MNSLLLHFSFWDPGPVGNSGRYSERMLPEVEMKDFRKGAQVHFCLNLLVAACSIICFYQ